MLTGTDSLWWLWLGFFREHLAAFVSLLVLLPLSLVLNWRLALLLIALCVVFAGLTALVLRKAEAGQSAVERHYGDLAERASDALGNVALVQSYSPHRGRGERAAERRRQAARRADAGAVVVGDLRGADARLDHADGAVDLRRRHLAQHPRPDHRRRDRHLHELRRPADHPPRAGGRLRQPAVHGPAAADRVLRGRRHRADRARPPRRDRSGPGPRPGRVRRRLLLLRRQAHRRRRPQVHRAAGRDHRAGRPDRRRQVDRAGAAAPRLRSASRLGQDRRHGHPRPEARGAAPQHRRGVPGGAAVQPLDRRQPARRPARRHRRRAARRRRDARRRSTSSTSTRRASRRASASAAACCPAASASGSRSRGRW